jgi:HTH-type transcriptional regulator, transcriptional repressor of NAD biosynthesis genes
MNIRHIPFDVQRTLFPMSATAIRSDVFKQWNNLPDSVKPYFAIKVAILGTECTGKTTLTHRLSTHFNCTAVSEAARDLISNSNTFSPADLLLVANAHAHQIDTAVLANHPLVIIDTDIHITKSYSRFTFAQELNVSQDIYDANKASLYLYLNNDVDYIQDGTRLGVNERNLLDRSHRQVLKDHHIEIIEITGGWDDRFNKAVEHINHALASRQQLHLFTPKSS